MVQEKFVLCIKLVFNSSQNSADNFKRCTLDFLFNRQTSKGKNDSARTMWPSILTDYTRVSNPIAFRFHCCLILTRGY